MAVPLNDTTEEGSVYNVYGTKALFYCCQVQTICEVGGIPLVPDNEEQRHGK